MQKCYLVLFGWYKFQTHENRQIQQLFLDKVINLKKFVPKESKKNFRVILKID